MRWCDGCDGGQPGCAVTQFPYVCPKMEPWQIRNLSYVEWNGKKYAIQLTDKMKKYVQEHGQ